MTQQPLPAARPPRRRWPWIAGGIAAVAIAAALTIGLTRGPVPAPAPTLTGSTTSGLTFDYATPQPADFTITVVILSKQCFGSAGCDLTYRIQPTYTGDPADPGTTYTVTYEVDGGSDGAQIGNFTLTGTEASVNQQDSIQTASSAATLTAHVTAVLEN